MKQSLNALALIVITAAVYLRPLQGQTDQIARPRAANAVYAELFGKGILYGVFYERLITNRFGVSVGFSHWTMDTFLFTGPVDLTFVPVFLTWYPVGEKHHLYFDAGVDIVAGDFRGGFLSDESRAATSAAGVIGTGYCYRDTDGGLHFKIGGLLLVGSGGPEPWGNISLGFTF